MQHSSQGVIGVVLAGGQSRRYGTAKAFATLAGSSLLDHVVRRTAPQVEKLLIAAGAEDPRFAVVGLPRLTEEMTDATGERLGPLGGILAGLQWIATHEPRARWLASFSVDTPLLPLDLVARLRDVAQTQGTMIACGRSAGRLHPLIALWSPRVCHDLRTALEQGERSAHRFIERHHVAVVDFPAEPLDPFTNVNTPEDLAILARQFEP